MKVSLCFKKIFSGKNSFTQSQINSIKLIVEKHDYFYKKIIEICKNNSFDLDKQVSGKIFYYYLKPKNNKKIASKFDSLMYMNVIAIQAKTIFEARVLGFLLKTIVDGTYDYYNDHPDIISDDRFLLNEIENMSEPQGLFKNKPTANIFGRDESIAFGRSKLNKLVFEPVHLALKDDGLLEYLSTF